MINLSRREFLHGSALLAATAAAERMLPSNLEAQDTQPPPAAPRGPNERLNVAVIGVNGRGKDHVTGFAGRNNCVVTHICDCDSAVVTAAVNSARQRNTGNVQPQVVQDLRRIMDNTDIHIVSIATPNHWHSLAAIWAIQAGKDVYVEKPVSHNVWEGRRLAEIARRNNKIVQAGTQARSSTGIRQALEWLQGGGLGAIRVSRGLCYKDRPTIGNVMGEQATPRTCDYNLWSGPAAQVPLTRRRLHYDWHWVWNTGNGDLGNQGIHQMDIARWALNKNEVSRGVVSVGGRFGYVDNGETANTQICVFDYNEQQLIFEVRGLRTEQQRGVAVGNIVHCANGYLVISASYNGAVAYNNDGSVNRRFTGGGNHYDNFIQAVRSRRRQDLKGEVTEGHLSSALCHLGNISYRLGARQAFGESPMALGANRDVIDTFTSMTGHLRNNNVNLANTQLTVGRALRINPETERFINDAEADRMLTREYRQGFVVPA